MNYQLLYVCACICVLVLVCCVSVNTQIGGFALSPLAGPVDMLQMPKQLLMDGYRFQNSLFPPEEINQMHDTIIPPRVGVFKNKAYTDVSQTGGRAGAGAGGAGGAGMGASVATSAQLKSLGDQDQYLIGRQGDPIVDIDKPFSPWQPYDSPLEIHYANKNFSWGDVLSRYKGKFCSSRGSSPPLRPPKGSSPP